ncbi:LLM class flavin-dependent oxidoreductase [Streptosporangium sp. NBC_01755]|uniref:LLM class flavin-dependent oxidoreductase n=1 Tax=unclassified Streptosporangium TaxID=2632669 RepID=UPI002DDA5765|nr:MULTISPECIES: LLM class flavin-dependent oxidoreductase [unclassified Streptosporangium]WSA29328.1 LLM class flavin-dependent oxidoreductase [Streptosporangium sp. NBC_01810]WSC99230.1 LLM class flavin-dependent oxidoreductase [Streptosporangium sp. NBC_01755]
MRFGLGVPTGTEGLMYPVPYADAGEAVELAVQAERLGFDSVWGNDHVTTQGYVREEFDTPPRYYDPFAYLSYVAALTSRIRLATAIMVLPFRNPVVAANSSRPAPRPSPAPPTGTPICTRRSPPRPGPPGRGSATASRGSTAIRPCARPRATPPRPTPPAGRAWSAG